MHRITRTITAAGTGLALALGAVAVGTPAAVAKPTEYLTKAEFAKVRKGMPMWKVHRIVGFSGRPLGGASYGSTTRVYQDVERDGGAFIGYKKVNGTWKVTYKEADWGWPAPNTPYISQVKFNQIRKGMSMNKVHRTVGAKDTQLRCYGWPGEQQRIYRVGSKLGNVGYVQKNGTWKVAYKSFGLGPGWA